MKPELVIHANHPEPLVRMFQRLGVDAVGGSDKRSVELGEKTVQIWWGATRRGCVLPKSPYSYAAENGWFPQKDGVHLDKLGTNAASSLVGMLRPDMPIREDHAEWVAALRRRFESSTRPEGCPTRPFLFIPLQEERDWNMKEPSCCKVSHGSRVAWFVEAVCRAFPRHILVFREHPKGRSPRIPRLPCVLQHGHAHFLQSGNSYQWCEAAEAVISVSSTVLLEAMILGKPVAAFGRGVFTGNGAVLECQGNEQKLREVLRWKSNPETVARFTSLLRSYQVPYSVKPEETDRYPVLKGILEVIEQARNQGYGPHRQEVAARLIQMEECWPKLFTTVTCVYAPTPEVEKVTLECLQAICSVAPKVRKVLGIDLASPDFLQKAARMGFEFVRPDSPHPPRMAELVRKIVSTVSTPYTLCVESDVILTRHALQYVLNVMEKEPADMVAVQCATVNKDGNPNYPTVDRINAEDVGRIVPDPMYPTFSGVLWRTEVLRHAKWPAEQLGKADKYLWKAIRAKNPKARSLIHTCATVRHYGCVSRNAAKEVDSARASVLMRLEEARGLKGKTQDLEEFTGWWRAVKALKAKVYVEVGSFAGRSLWAIQDALEPGARIVSVDIAAVTPHKQRLEDILKELKGRGFDVRFVQGDSHSEETFSRVREACGGMADAVFIDGDHGLPGVTEDFRLYRQLVRAGGKVGVHDILYQDVRTFWKLLHKPEGTTEFTTSGVMGIGVVPF